MTRLLDDPAFDIGDGLRLTLPSLLAKLAGGATLRLRNLRAHQESAWYGFLVQLGALVAYRAGRASLDQAEGEWRRTLLNLTGEAGEEAWQLVVDDVTRPAFLQNPMPEGSLASFRNVVETPDDLDILVTAKNHDVKQSRMRHARPEHWVFALVTLQTFQGYSGRGNYGVARMNSGFGSRPHLAIGRSESWGERFRRDVGVWLETRAETLESRGYSNTGAALLWTLPWDGASSLELRSVDPFFIETCRRVRLVERDGRIVALTAATTAPLLDAKELQGDTGDVWTPVRLSDKGGGTAAFTISASGFRYDVLVNLLLGSDWPRRPALTVRDEDGPTPLLVARALARGQGTTDGYHERILPISQRMAAYLRSDADRRRLHDLAQDRVGVVQEVVKRVLRPALCALLQGGEDDIDFREPRARPWIDAFDRSVDAVFFDDLARAVEIEDEEERQRAWQVRLLELGRRQLEDAIESAPVPVARRPRAIARAEGTFYGAARRGPLPLAFESVTREEPRHDAA